MSQSGIQVLRHLKDTEKLWQLFMITAAAQYPGDTKHQSKRETDIKLGSSLEVRGICVGGWEQPQYSCVFCLQVCVGFSVCYFWAMGQSEAYAIYLQNKSSLFCCGLSASMAVFVCLFGFFLGLLACFSFLFFFSSFLDTMSILQDRKVGGKNPLWY